MSSAHADNLLIILTQLQTALNTTVKDAKTRRESLPDCVLLVASGEINKAAQAHIVDNVKDPRVSFRDSDDLIPAMDRLMPEFWLGIDAKRIPYLRAFRDNLINQSDTIDLTQIGVSSQVASPITDETFVQLYLHRYTKKVVKFRGQSQEDIDVDTFTVQQLLQQRYELMLITGDAGAGKTTSLRRLAMLMTEHALQKGTGKDIPVLLRSTEIARGSGRLVDIAADVTRKVTMDDSAAFERDDLTAGNVTLLIDGYDELATGDLRQSFAVRIDEFHREFPKCRMILTSRESPYLKDIESVGTFVRLHISPIDLSQAQRIIERISKGKDLPTNTTTEILRRLDTVHGIDLSPLLVTVFVATTDYARTDIPANITELFKKFTEMMLGRWDQGKGLAQQYQANVKDFLLTRLAFEMHKANATSINMADFKSGILAILAERGLSGDTEILFDEIVNRSGLLRIVDEELSFRHLLIQEFFAGRGIPSSEFMRSILGKVWWTRAIIFYFGERPGDEPALAALPTQLAEMDGTDLYQAAIAVGLAVQACYLTKTEVKTEVMEWVIHSMAGTFDDVLAWFHAEKGVGEILRIVMYYMYGRDSVSARTTPEVAERIFTELKDIEATNLTSHQERTLFWCLAGLIGLGEMERVEAMIKKFNPKDTRLLLPLLIGCVYVQKVQVVNDGEKKIAKRIAARIAPIVKHLTKEVIREMKGFVFELHSSGIKALDGPRKQESLEREYVDGDDTTSDTD